jgi:hypothetical protein
VSDERDTPDEIRAHFIGGEKELYRRGPRAVAYVDLQGFPLDNLHADGCKHSVYSGDEALLRGGAAMPCHKCGAMLIPPAVVRRLYAEMIHLFPELGFTAEDTAIAIAGGDALWRADEKRYQEPERSEEQ